MIPLTSDSVKQNKQLELNKAAAAKILLKLKTTISQNPESSLAVKVVEV